MNINEKQEPDIQAHNWKLYEASMSLYVMYSERQRKQDELFDKWIMTTAAGSFGLSFAFIDKIVELSNAVTLELLIGGWSCFLSILVIGFIGFMVSSLEHSRLAKEESESLALKYEGKEPEYKSRSVFFDVNRVFGYLQILLFIGGSVCLFLFIGNNLL